METIQEFKIIWGYLKKYKREVRKLIILAVVGSSITASIPYIYGKLVDLASIQTTDLSFILALLGIWLLMSITSNLLTRIIGLRGDFLSMSAANDLICENSKHVIELPLKFHKENKIGEIFSKIERAATYLKEIISNIVFWMLPQILTIFGGIAILFFVEWRLSIGILILFSGFILITFYKTKAIIENQKKLNKITELVSGNLYDAFLNIQTIKSCAVENFQKQRTEKDFRQKLEPIYKNFRKSWIYLSICQDIFFSTGFVCIFGFAILLLKNNSITPGELVMCLGYLTILKHPLINLAWLWQHLKTGITTIKRTKDLLEIKTEDYNLHGKIIKEPKGEIEFRNVGFGYKKGRVVLQDINLKADAGKKIAIVGGSGEGKTTLVDLISLYFVPTSGKIFVDGIDTRKMNLSFLRKMIAYVPQEVILFNDTVKNNIKYGKPDASGAEIVSATRAANAERFIESFPKKYDQIVGERGIKLSTGQKQRLAIARALIRDPKILILDEATSSLDSASEKLVQEALEELIKNRTTFIVAHRLSTIKKADKILVLENGKIIEQGTHLELIKKKGAYYKFYSLQFKV
jgi:ABC-type multidrug transport system fused ATPase/permease subunit